MQVKTFRGPTTQSVLQRIKSELGPEAVILSTNSVKENDIAYCEATAALENVPIPLDKPVEPGPSPFSDQFNSEWKNFKGYLLALLEPKIEYHKLSNRHQAFMRHLEKEKIAPETKLRLWDLFRKNPKATGLSILTKTIPTKSFTRQRWPQKCHAFAGPHGTGKTATVLRLALEASHRSGKRICLANADTSRSRGRIYLRHYAELSGFDYRELSTIQDWLDLKNNLHGFDRVYIDFPGLNRQQQMSSWMESTGANLIKDICVHLCLSPTLSREHLQIARKKYLCKRLSSLVWTKLDEACNYGALVDVGIESRLPVSVLSYGPGLKDSLAPATEEALWKLILKHTFPNE